MKLLLNDLWSKIVEQTSMKAVTHINIYVPCNAINDMKIQIRDEVNDDGSQ